MMAEVNDKEHYVTIQNKQKKVKVAGAMFRPGQTRDSVGRLFTPDQVSCCASSSLGSFLT